MGEMDETIVSRLVGFSFLYLEEEKRAISSILTTSLPGVRGQPLSIIPGCHSEVRVYLPDSHTHRQKYSSESCPVRSAILGTGWQYSTVRPHIL